MNAQTKLIKVKQSNTFEVTKVTLGDIFSNIAATTQMPSLVYSLSCSIASFVIAAYFLVPMAFQARGYWSIGGEWILAICLAAIVGVAVDRLHCFLDSLC